jgi:hypothetical protein
MTKEDIYRMANYVGIKGPAPARQGFRMYASSVKLRRFAALVAAAEREACAKLCDEWPLGRDDVHSIAAAIRARGNI